MTSSSEKEWAALVIENMMAVNAIFQAVRRRGAGSVVNVKNNDLSCKAE
jgi:hypothetical protein